MSSSKLLNNISKIGLGDEIIFIFFQDLKNDYSFKSFLTELSRAQISKFFSFRHVPAKSFFFFFDVIHQRQPELLIW